MLQTNAPGIKENEDADILVERIYNNLSIRKRKNLYLLYKNRYKTIQLFIMESTPIPETVLRVLIRDLNIICGPLKDLLMPSVQSFLRGKPLPKLDNKSGFEYEVDILAQCTTRFSPLWE